MTLIKTGGGVTDIRGGYGGTYFTRDKSGLHQSAKPRRVKQLTAGQGKQRNAFIKARTYTQDPRWVSYYIYRALNNLPFIFDAIVTENCTPDVTGKYTLGGTYNNQNYYIRIDSTYYIYFSTFTPIWVISVDLDISPKHFVLVSTRIEGTYRPVEFDIGNPIVKLSLTPPPVDYCISTLQPPPEG